MCRGESALINGRLRAVSGKRRSKSSSYFNEIAPSYRLA